MENERKPDVDNAQKQVESPTPKPPLDEVGGLWVRPDHNTGNKSLKAGALVAVFIVVFVIVLVVILSSRNSNKNGPGLTYNNYLKIENGMTYDEVCNIFGRAGVQDSYTEYMGYTLAYYTWEKDGLYTYAVVVVGFENGKVCTKTQTGLN